MFTPTQKSKKKLYRIVFMKCSDHVGIFSNQCINENARCLGWIKLESLQAFCPSVVTSLLIRKKTKTLVIKCVISINIPYGITEVDIL